MSAFAIVTGGTRGIGLAIARALGSEGRPVIVCGREPGGVEAAVADLRSLDLDVQGRACDFADRGALAKLTKELSGTPLEVLVNNAGIGELGALIDTTD